MSKDSKNLPKEEKKKLKSLDKEEKIKSKMLEKENKKRIKEEKRRSKEIRKDEHSSTDVHKKDRKEDKKKDKKKDKEANVNLGTKQPNRIQLTENGTRNKMETKSSVQSAHKTEDVFKFKESRFVMPRGQKGFMFPITPGPARYPVTRINYPIMKARRQVDLTKKMIAGPSPPAYTMGIRHSELREFYNKIQ